jgi:hypothetical protein
MAIPVIREVVIPQLRWLGNDWQAFFRPSAFNLRNPYAVEGNYCPPWTFVLLWPSTVLPDWLSKGTLETLVQNNMLAFLNNA